MIYLGRAIVRPFPDLIDFVAFDHAKWALVVNKIYGIRSGVSALRIFRSFSVSILSESVTPRRQIDVGRIMRLWKDERLAQCPFGRFLLCFFYHPGTNNGHWRCRPVGSPVIDVAVLRDEAISIREACALFRPPPR